MSLGPLFNLDRPIEARTWKRLTFLYTTGAYVSQADTVNDLVVKSEERVTLWRSLRERALAERAVSTGRSARAAIGCGAIKAFRVDR